MSIDMEEETFVPFADVVDYLSQGVINNQILGEPNRPYEKRGTTERETFIKWFQDKTKRAAVEIVNLMEATGNSPGINVVRYQLIKSATSSAANYRAACRARSGNEFYAKICIVVEETDETLFWLEILEESNIVISSERIKVLQSEWLEILKIVAKAKQNSYNGRRNP